ncbi:hypothetical protein ES703_86177 [subsurface metagenome]
MKLKALLYMLTIGFLVMVIAPAVNADGIDDYTKLMLHGDTDDPFIDSSCNPHEPINALGNVSLSADPAQFGSSIYFDNEGDYLSIPHSTDWEFGSGPFTIDGWVKHATGTSDGGHIFKSSAINLHGIALWFPSQTNTNRMQFRMGDGSSYHGPGEFTLTLPFGIGWHHFALVRDGSNFLFFLDGSIEETFSWGGSVATGGAEFRIGGSGLNASNHDFNGYIDEFRVSKGVARWTLDFSSSLPEGPYTYDETCEPPPPPIEISADIWSPTGALHSSALRVKFSKRPVTVTLYGYVFDEISYAIDDTIGIAGVESATLEVSRPDGGFDPIPSFTLAPDGTFSVDYTFQPLAGVTSDFYLSATDTSTGNWGEVDSISIYVEEKGKGGGKPPKE